MAKFEAALLVYKHSEIHSVSQSCSHDQWYHISITKNYSRKINMAQKSLYMSYKTCHKTWSTLVEIMAWSLMAPSHYLNQCWLIIREVLWHSPEGNFIEREREIKFIGLFENRGHRGPCSPYKPFNHNLYIGIIIFPHIDNPQSTGYN